MGLCGADAAFAANAGSFGTCPRISAETFRSSAASHWAGIAADP
jgi:hypothetical protein